MNEVLASGVLRIAQLFTWSILFFSRYLSEFIKKILPQVFFIAEKYVRAEILGYVNSRPRQATKGRRKDFTPWCSELVEYHPYSEVEYPIYSYE